MSISQVTQAFTALVSLFSRLIAWVEDILNPYIGEPTFVEWVLMLVAIAPVLFFVMQHLVSFVIGRDVRKLTARQRFDRERSKFVERRRKFYERQREGREKRRRYKKGVWS